MLDAEVVVRRGNKTLRVSPESVITGDVICDPRGTPLRDRRSRRQG